MCEEKLLVRELIERFLNEGKRIFVYMIFNDLKNEGVDIDREKADKIFKLLTKHSFDEYVWSFGDRTKMVFSVSSAIVKYKGKTYLLENKKMDTYFTFYFYYQITPLDIIEIPEE